MKSNKGFTLAEILIVITILGLLMGAYVFKNYAAIRPAAQTVSTDTLKQQLESTYSVWANAGGTHNSSAATLAAQANMAADLIQVMTGTPGVNVTPTNQASTGVTESNANLSPPSNVARMQLRYPTTTTANGVTYLQYYIAFKPSTTNTGTWYVQTTQPTTAF